MRLTSTGYPEDRMNVYLGYSCLRRYPMNCAGQPQSSQAYVLPKEFSSYFTYPGEIEGLVGLGGIEILALDTNAQRSQSFPLLYWQLRFQVQMSVFQKELDLSCQHTWIDST